MAVIDRKTLVVVCFRGPNSGANHIVYGNARDNDRPTVFLIRLILIKMKVSEKKATEVITHRIAG